MPVTFGIYNYEGGAEGSLGPVYLKEIERERTLNKKVQAIPDEEHIVIALGEEGPKIVTKFTVRSPSDYALADAMDNHFIVPEGSTYPELPSGSIWYCEKSNIKRMPAYVNKWDVTCYLIARGQVI